MRVLLVDDQDQVRRSLAMMLARLGFAVRDYDCADSALTCIALDPPPDLLVTDIDLGVGLNGFELAAAVRRWWPALPVLFITGGIHAVARNAIASGEPILQKPFRLSELRSAISALIADTSVPWPAAERMGYSVSAAAEATKAFG